MAKTQKELAFLRDLYVNKEWTGRFADLIDKHVKFSDNDNLLYINAGTGDHAFAIRDKIGDETAVFATCQDEDILSIARDKAAAVGSDVDFSMIRFEDGSFDTVLADASLVGTPELKEFVNDAARVAKHGGTVALMFVAAGSFGEIFSLLWEVLFNEDLGEHGANAERLIAEQPTISQIEAIGAGAGLVNLKAHTAVEIFEYDNGAAFISSPLVADFLIPEWLETLSENEKEQVSNKLAQLIDAEDADLTFRFSVKATLLAGEKG
ncbi:MAG TPA: class I SAM-dependent methyltransferase [Pyrinomonadaceae bacterium]|nr:class I SAM-dependent methyltransferase [Pyrinomonadaceae bacterium]